MSDCDIRVGNGVNCDFEVYCFACAETIYAGYYSRSGAGEGDPRLLGILEQVQAHIQENAGPCQHRHVVSYTAWNGWSEDRCEDCGIAV